MERAAGGSSRCAYNYGLSKTDGQIRGGSGPNTGKWGWSRISRWAAWTRWAEGPVPVLLCDQDRSEVTDPRVCESVPPTAHHTAVCVKASWFCDGGSEQPWTTDPALAPRNPRPSSPRSLTQTFPRPPPCLRLAPVYGLQPHCWDRWSMLLHLDVCGASVLTPGRLGAVPCDLWPPSAGLQESLVVPGRGELEVADPWAGVRCRVGGQSGHCFSDQGGRQAGSITGEGG